MPKEKKDYSGGSRDNEYNLLAKQINQNIMKCKKCNDGWIENIKGEMQLCNCCSKQINAVKELGDIEVSFFDGEYEAFKREKQNVYYNQPTDKQCLDCKGHFQTMLKGRGRCESCFKEYSKEFKSLKNVVIKNI